MTVGIPRGLLYYRYGVMWEEFFGRLGIKTVVSRATDKAILSEACRYSIDESCLPSKIFLGHVASLMGQCDCVFVPRVGGVMHKGDVCVKFNALVDIAANTFFDLKIIHHNIDCGEGKTELSAYMSLGKALAKPALSTLNAYMHARRALKNYRRKRYEEFLERLSVPERTKIMIVAHPYNALDEFVGKPIERELERLGCTVVYAFDAPVRQCIKAAQSVSNTLYWTFSKELVGAIPLYADRLDGIVFLTAFPCGPDSLVNELALRSVPIPAINLVLDEQQSPTGLSTRLESFVDILSTPAARSQYSA